MTVSPSAGRVRSTCSVGETMALVHPVAPSLGSTSWVGTPARAARWAGGEPPGRTGRTSRWVPSGDSGAATTTGADSPLRSDRHADDRVNEEPRRVRPAFRERRPAISTAIPANTLRRPRRAAVDRRAGEPTAAGGGVGPLTKRPRTPAPPTRAPRTAPQSTPTPGAHHGDSD